MILAGVALILAASGGGLSLDSALLGDAMFLVASALGATYLVYVQHRRLDPVVAATLVGVASAMVVIPWHFLFADSAIHSAPLDEIAWQIVFQGVLVGCFALFALNYAALAIGSQSVGALSALVPVIGALCSLLITRDGVSALEWIAIVAISLGVLVAVLPARAALAWRRPGKDIVALGRPTAF
jgi:drug/metabolite transporter (DMT)-like permease